MKPPLTVALLIPSVAVELVKQSLFNITSLSPEQVSDYALNSPLGMAMKAELLSRGVNVENYLSMIEGPETL